jgi:predicted AlkP superfamily pyrophosphatase or phosphodiesterase
VKKGGVMAEQPTTLVRDFLKSVIDRGGSVRIVDDHYVIEGIELSKRDVMLSGLLHKVALTHRQMVDAFF